MNDVCVQTGPMRSGAADKETRVTILNLSPPDADIGAYRAPGARVVSVILPADDPLACPPREDRNARAALRGDATRLPFADAAFDAVLCLDALDQVLDDQAAIDEIARVLRPGGRLILRVLRESSVAWLDAHNLFRYFQSAAGGGNHPRNCGEHGWRRHYRPSDVRQMLAARFQLCRLEGRGLGLAEPLDLGLLLLCRWRFPLDGLYCRARSPYRALSRLDDRIRAGRFGFRLLAVARRRDS